MWFDGSWLGLIGCGWRFDGLIEFVICFGLGLEENLVHPTSMTSLVRPQGASYPWLQAAAGNAFIILMSF